MAFSDTELWRMAQARRWMDGVRNAIRRGEMLRDMVDDAMERAGGLKGIDYSRTVVCETPDGDSLADAVEMADALREYAESVWAEVEEMEADARDRLARMGNERHADLLRMRYLDLMTWDDICRDMGMTYAAAATSHRRALIEAYDVMPVSWRDDVKAL